MSKQKKATRRDTLFDRLDAAVMQQFPTVQCESGLNIFACRMVTSWWEKGTEDTKLKPALARQVKAFVAGFMSAEEFDA